MKQFFFFFTNPRSVNFGKRGKWVMWFWGDGAGNRFQLGRLHYCLIEFSPKAAFGDFFFLLKI